jgi:hypothetical protein
MAITQTKRPTHEWPLLILAVAVVCAICIPLWQWSSRQSPQDHPWGDTMERASRLLLGPEQIACYCCFTWGGLILLSRYLEMRRQRRAFSLGLLPTEEGARILPEDARPLQRRVDQIAAARGPFILANMIRLAVGKYAISRSSRDVSETVRMQAEVELGRMVTSMATVHYLAWAIPAIGFLGTVRGLAMGLGMAKEVGEVKMETLNQFLAQTTQHLNFAFDCTLVALALSVPIMFLIHTVQRDEESLVIDCQQYCLEHLVNRLYEPGSHAEVAAEAPPRPAIRARIS